MNKFFKGFTNYRQNGYWLVARRHSFRFVLMDWSNKSYLLGLLGNTSSKYIYICIDHLNMTDMCLFKFSAAIFINLGEIPKMSLDFFGLRLFSIFNTSLGSAFLKNKLRSLKFPR